MKNNNTTFGHWDDLRGTARSSIGGWKINGGVSIHEWSLFDQLMTGEYSWSQVLSLSICGKMPGKDEARLIEVVWMCGAYPDPRIWCNQVSALAGTMRCTPVSGTLVGTLTSDAIRYGPMSSLYASDFLIECLKRRDQGEALHQIIEQMPISEIGSPKIPGFVRPVASGDGRVHAMRAAMDKLNIAPGKCLTLALEIDRYTQEKYKEGINACGFLSAVLLDLGYSPKESHQLQSVVTLAGATACYSDAISRPAGTFMPLRCEDIRYTGAPARSLEKT
jgi:hypothetical protein